MTIKQFCYGLIIGSLLTGCATPKKQSATSNNSFNEIENILQSFVDTAGIPGIAIAITGDNEVVYQKGFGVINAETNVSIQPHHIFHIASVSKTFTATAVMQLYEKGKLDISKPLVHYLPYFKLDDERYKVITIKQLLNHTSGMLDVEDYEWEKAVSDEGAAERYIKSLADKKLISNPGEQFHYSNAAFDIMADLIAKTSGMSFEKYVKDYILIPLKMTESSFPNWSFDPSLTS